MDKDKAYDKYSPEHLKDHLRFDGWAWNYDFQHEDLYGVKRRPKLRSKSKDLLLSANQISDQIRYVIKFGWDAMQTRYYPMNPKLGHHIVGCRNLSTAKPRSFGQYVASARYIMEWLKGGDLNDPCRYGGGRDARAREKLLDDCRLSEYTKVGLQRFNALPNSFHIHYAKYLFTPTILGTLYAGRLRKPWPFADFCSNGSIVRPMLIYEDPTKL